MKSACLGESNCWATELIAPTHNTDLQISLKDSRMLRMLKLYAHRNMPSQFPLSSSRKCHIFSSLLYQMFSLSHAKGCNLSTSRFSLTVNKHHPLQNVSAQTHSNWHNAFIHSFFINFPVVLRYIPACNGRKTLYRSITQTYPVLHSQSQVTAKLTWFLWARKGPPYWRWNKHLNLMCWKQESVFREK